ncbi:MAG: DUF4238 domain-containing protein [Phycisphaerales bacterium JB039]
MSKPRKHHYVPQFYLSGFTAVPGSSRLFVLDKQTGRSYPSRASNAACERDFYIVEVEDEGDPFAVEKFFANIEDIGADALRFIIKERAVPTDMLYHKLMAFLAVMAVRGPAILDAIEKPIEQILKTVAWHMTATPDRYERMMERLREDGHDTSGITYESMREFVEQGEYTISMGQNFRISSLLRMLKPTEPLLAARNWTVISATEDAPDFICSDRPMTISWSDPRRNSLYPPGFGLKGTTVMFPVARRLALLGLFEELRPAVQAGPRTVAVINTFTAMYARRFVYSGSDDFMVVLGDDGQLVGRDEFMKRITQDEP